MNLYDDSHAGNQRRERFCQYTLPTYTRMDYEM